MPAGPIRLTLPYPPSVNMYWRYTTLPGRKHGFWRISKKGLLFRRIVVAACMAAGIKALKGKLELIEEVWPPDTRTRDLDNIQKALWDALQHGGCYESDSQIKETHQRMHDYSDRRPQGRTEVRLRRIPDSGFQPSLWEDQDQ